MAKNENNLDWCLKITKYDVQALLKRSKIVIGSSTMIQIALSDLKWHTKYNRDKIAFSDLLRITQLSAYLNNTET